MIFKLLGFGLKDESFLEEVKRFKNHVKKWSPIFFFGKNIFCVKDCGWYGRRFILESFSPNCGFGAGSLTIGFNLTRDPDSPRNEAKWDRFDNDAFVETLASELPKEATEPVSARVRDSYNFERKNGIHDLESGMIRN